MKMKKYKNNELSKLLFLKLNNIFIFSIKEKFYDGKI